MPVTISLWPPLEPAAAGPLDALTERLHRTVLTEPQAWAVIAAAAFMSAAPPLLLDTLLAHALPTAGTDGIEAAAEAACAVAWHGVPRAGHTALGPAVESREARSLEAAEPVGGRDRIQAAMLALAVSVVAGSPGDIENDRSVLEQLGAAENTVQDVIGLATAVNGIAIAVRASGSLRRLREGHLRQVETDDAPARVGPYSTALISGDLVFCSGQVGIDPISGEMVSDDPRSQARQALSNLGRVLAAARVGPRDVVRTTVYVTDLDDFAAVNDAYVAFFGGHLPARALVQVAGLALGARVEIDAIAVKSRL